MPQDCADTHLPEQDMGLRIPACFERNVGEGPYTYMAHVKVQKVQTQFPKHEARGRGLPQLSPLSSSFRCILRKSYSVL